MGRRDATCPKRSPLAGLGKRRGVFFSARYRTLPSSVTRIMRSRLKGHRSMYCARRSRPARSWAPSLTAKFTPKPECWQAFGDGEDELPVRHGLTDLAGDVLGDEKGALLVAAWTEATSSTGKSDEELVAAPGAANARETLLEVAAGEERRLSDCISGSSPWPTE